jgi:hypothetical protein
LTPGGFGVEHAGQATTSGSPHSPQNFRPASFATPQASHFTAATQQLSQIPARKRRYARSVTSDSKPAHVADAAGDARARRGEHLVGLWWRRVPRVLWRPQEVLVALRETDEDDEAARQEPILAIVLLAGMTAVLLMGGTLVDDRTVDGLVAAAVTFIAGALYGAAGYFVLGLGVLLGIRGANGDATFRQARHLVAFSAVPIAAAFLLVTPVVAVAYGVDFFRGSAPSSSTGVVLAVGLPFVAWALALLIAGLRVTYRLAWRGVVAALALAGVFVGVFVAVPSVL